MDHYVMSVCEEQKRLEMESELLDGGSDAEDTADVALHLMDISDDGEGATGQPRQEPAATATVPVSSSTGSANTDKVGTVPAAADNSKSLATMDSASANTDKVGIVTAGANPVDPVTIAGVGTSSGPVVVGANTNMVGSNYTTGPEGASADTKLVGTGTDLPFKLSSVQPASAVPGDSATSAGAGASSGLVGVSANTNKVGTSYSTVHKGASANTISVGTGANLQGTHGSMPPPSDGTYLAVNLYKRKASVAPNLLGGAPCNPASTGSIYNGEASRIQHCHASFDFPTKMNVMSSFSIDSMRCGCCNEHWKILEKRAHARHVERRTFVLTDQHFVATAPSVTPDKQCLKIIRIENATLWELFNFFSAMLSQGDLDLPVGSAILFGSASHLANVGLAYYTEELVLLNKKLREMFSGEVVLLPCPFMLMEGSSNGALLRSIFELASWQKQVWGGDTYYLKMTMDVVLTKLLENSTDISVASPIRLMLPSSLVSDGKSRWDSGGANLPAGVLPLSKEDEKLILTTLIAELENNLALNLDPMPNLHPDSTAISQGNNARKFLVVGASNADRTGDALERAGMSVTRAIIPGWRCVKSQVEKMLELVQEKIAGIRGPCTVVIQMYDNSFFLAKPDEGGLIPAVRESEGGKYHVHGESIFIPKELQYSTFVLSKPILDAAALHQTILVSPLPRYLHEGCCQDPGHVANLSDDDYQSSLDEAVTGCRRNLKDFAFRHGLRNLRVVCPWSNLKHSAEDIWADPVHLNRVGTDTVASLLIKTAEQTVGMEPGGNKRKGRGGGGGGRGGEQGGSHERGRGGGGRGGEQGGSHERGRYGGGGYGGRGQFGGNWRGQGGYRGGRGGSGRSGGPRRF